MDDKIREGKMRILVIPTQQESRAVLKPLPGVLPEPGWDVPAWRAGNLLIVEPGMGPELTEAVLPRLESLMPQAVWLFGWCGGLTPELRVGDLVLADATILSEQSDGPTKRILHPLPESLLEQVRWLAERLDRRLVIGPVLTSDHLLASAEQKRAGAASGAVAVEMEAGPLAHWAVARSVPFVHFRVVLDPLLSPLPPTPLPADPYGRVSQHRLILHVLSHPLEWTMLWRLMQQAREARKIMAEVMAMLTGTGGLLAPGNTEGG